MLWPFVSPVPSRSWPREGREPSWLQPCLRTPVCSPPPPTEEELGRGGIKIASYCSAPDMDSCGLKLYSGTHLFSQPFTALRYHSDFNIFLKPSVEEFGIITSRYCTPLSHSCVLCCFTVLQACHSAPDICSRQYWKYKVLAQEQLIKILPVVCLGTRRIEITVVSNDLVC